MALQPCPSNPGKMILASDTCPQAPWTRRLAPTRQLAGVQVPRKFPHQRCHVPPLVRSPGLGLGPGPQARVAIDSVASAGFWMLMGIMHTARIPVDKARNWIHSNTIDETARIRITRFSHHRQHQFLLDGAEK